MQPFLQALLLILSIFSDAAWIHNADSQKVDPSSIVFPGSFVPQASAPERSHISGEPPYVHAIDALYAVTVRLKALLIPDAKKNLLVSPVSTTLALAETLLGARGYTRNQILNILTAVNRTRATPEATVTEFNAHMGALIKFLNASLTSDRAYRLHLASALFFDYLLNLPKDYKMAATDVYGMELMRLDFRGDPHGTVDTINQWAERHTMGTIKQVFSHPLPNTTAAILTNAIYFKADWEDPFNPDYTMSGKFKTSDYRTVDIEFMRGQLDLDYAESKKCGCRMVKIPYKRGQAAMYVILPGRGDLYNIHEFASTLTLDDIRDLIASSKLTSVTLVLPKMRLAQTISIRKILSLLQEESAAELQQRMHAAISEQDKKQDRERVPCNTCSQRYQTRCGSKAAKPDVVSRQDANGSSDDLSFKIGDIIQQVFLEVSEVGTEAAAVGSTLVDYFGDFLNFVVDRPFVFFIKHEITGSPLFWGRIVDPTSDDT